MSRPAPGTYIIYNSTLTPSGERLAITFNGSKQALTATVMNGSNAQRFVLKDYNASTQHIRPQDNQSVEACFGSGCISILPNGNYVWNITQDSKGYIIKDGGRTVAWGLTQPTHNTQVTFAPDSGNEKQRWSFMKADEYKPVAPIPPVVPNPPAAPVPLPP